MVDLARMSYVDKTELCRKYYLGGFAFLPFLWFVNVVWFFREAFCKEASENEEEHQLQLRIRKYVTCSLIGTIIWTVIITTWVIIFQVNRDDWGATADYMSFIIPKGIP